MMQHLRLIELALIFNLQFVYCFDTVEWFHNTFRQGRHWIKQKIDHHNPKSNTFWQLYFRKHTYFGNTDKSPVFLYISGEHSSPETKDTLEEKYTWIQYAKRHGALCFILEHRYYGLSLPFKIMTNENLTFLTIDQALRDIEYFIKVMKSYYKLKETNRWIVFGYSYSGELAVYARLRYSNLIWGAVASSAPVDRPYEYSGYQTVFYDAIIENANEIGQDCYNILSQAVNEILSIIKDKKRDQLADLKDDLHMCQQLDLDNLTEIHMLFDKLITIIWHPFHHQRSIDFGVDINNIKDMCMTLTNDKYGNTARKRLGALIESMCKLTNEQCFDHLNTQEELDRRTENVNDQKDKMLRQWTYQECRELAGFVVSTDKNVLFRDTFPRSYSENKCTKLFNLCKSSKEVNDVIDKHLKEFKGKNVIDHVTNLAFTNGSTDPWLLAGVLEFQTPEKIEYYKKRGIVSHVLKGYGHVTDHNWHKNSENRSVQYKDVQNKISDLIGEWLKQ